MPSHVNVKAVLTIVAVTPVVPTVPSMLPDALFMVTEFVASVIFTIHVKPSYVALGVGRLTVTALLLVSTNMTSSVSSTLLIPVR